MTSYTIDTWLILNCFSEDCPRFCPPFRPKHFVQHFAEHSVPHYNFGWSIFLYILWQATTFQHMVWFQFDPIAKLSDLKYRYLSEDIPTGLCFVSISEDKWQMGGCVVRSAWLIKQPHEHGSTSAKLLRRKAWQKFWSWAHRRSTRLTPHCLYKWMQDIVHYLLREEQTNAHFSTPRIRDSTQ